MQKDRQQLANGDISVWEEDPFNLVIHHSAGLTLQLSDTEVRDLRKWLDTHVYPCHCSECRWERARAHDLGGSFTDHHGYTYPEEQLNVV